jgi:uncharacterized protein with PIN domain
MLPKSPMAETKLIRCPECNGQLTDKSRTEPQTPGWFPKCECCQGTGVISVPAN